MKHGFLMSLLILVTIALFVVVARTQAAIPFTSLSGWAESETIGWISLDSKNCDPDSNGTITSAEAATTGCTAGPSTVYGVTVATTTGYLTGYGWSDNVGWVKFGGLLSGFPDGGSISEDALIQADNSTIDGWIRVCSGMNNLVSAPNNQTAPNNECSGSGRTDGWDGWISLSGKSADNTPYGISYNATTEKFTGHAWGSDVVGWVNFARVIATSTIVVDPRVECNPATDPNCCPGGSNCSSCTTPGGCPPPCSGTLPQYAFRCDASIGSAVTPAPGNPPTCQIPAQTNCTYYFDCPVGQPYDSVARGCKVIDPTETGSCVATVGNKVVTKARVGDRVVWTVNTEGTVTWTGSQVSNGTTGSSVAISYLTVGRKDMKYSIDGGQVLDCLNPQFQVFPSSNLEEF